MKLDFSRGCWSEQEVQTAFTLRYQDTCSFTQGDDYIASVANPNHPEGFDNISLITREGQSGEVKATIHCSFEGNGCPEIIIVDHDQIIDDGVIRYGACFEVVLYHGGINVWRHYQENGKRFWHKRLGLEYPVASGEKHELTVALRENYMDIWLNGQKTSLRVEDLFENYHVGITACEGIARIYDMTIH